MSAGTIIRGTVIGRTEIAWVVIGVVIRPMIAAMPPIGTVAVVTRPLRRGAESPTSFHTRAHTRAHTGAGAGPVSVHIFRELIPAHLL